MINLKSGMGSNQIKIWFDTIFETVDLIWSDFETRWFDLTRFLRPLIWFDFETRWFDLVWFLKWFDLIWKIQCGVVFCAWTSNETILDNFKTILRQIWDNFKTNLILRQIWDTLRQFWDNFETLWDIFETILKPILFKIWFDFFPQIKSNRFYSIEPSTTSCWIPKNW